MQKTFLFAAATVFLLSSCKPDLETSSSSANGLDLSRYISVGNSLTAGYADGSLYRSGQLSSYPSILAEQFRTVGGGEFKQPLLKSDWGFPGPKLVLGAAADCQGNVSLAPMPNQAVPDTSGDGASIAASGPYNNLGVPGIRVTDYLVPGYAIIAAAFANAPYAKRFFTNPAGRPIDEIGQIPHTFFSLWLGSNDVLLYALSGGEGPIGISDSIQFRIAYDSVLNKLTGNGAKGVLINIPDVTSIPHFTTIPHYVISPDIPLIIQDDNAAGGSRGIQDGEYILLTIPQDSIKCGGWGIIKPIPSAYVLTADEVLAIRTATTQYNSIIRQRAQQHNLAFVDIDNYLKTISSGIKFNGVDYNAMFVSGGAFSLDGVHLTPRGYALAANEIIRSINAHYGSTIPYADVNKYGGIRFP